MNPEKVLITDHLHEFLMEGFSKLGFECHYRPGISYEDVIKVINDYEGLVVSSNIKADKTLINKASKLKFIARAGSGMENIDVKCASENNIICINSPEGNRDAVGEHVIGLLLSLLNNINRSDNQIRKMIWQREPNRGIELQGKVIGIIGFGNTGQAFAEKMKGFDVSVLAYDKYKKNYCPDNDYIKESTLEDLYHQSDIVSIHVPLTEETYLMVNRDFINCFKKKIYFINTSRGKVLKTNDLIQCIEEGKIIGAALDVYENENLDKLKDEDKKWFNFLVNSDKVILTPHIAGWTAESREKIGKVLVNKIKKLYL